MKKEKNQINAPVRLIKGTDQLSNGQSFKACLPVNIYGKYFHCKTREAEFTALESMYKSQNK